MIRRSLQRVVIHLELPLQRAKEPTAAATAAAARSHKPQLRGHTLRLAFSRCYVAV